MCENLLPLWSLASAFKIYLLKCPESKTLYNICTATSPNYTYRIQCEPEGISSGRKVTDGQSIQVDLQKRLEVGNKGDKNDMMKKLLVYRSCPFEKAGSTKIA